ncbi:MAG: hypothetical protein IPK14_08725 [Blastocatellia bacterium]|nr:hypothetical protein [Blastocatellia bacterium]
MEQGNTSLTVKISGKSNFGKEFQEVAKLESFGNFGVLIHTKQPLSLGDVMHICGANNKPIASAEVVWVRGGGNPGVEVLLHRNTDLNEIIAINESITPAKTGMLPPLSGATKNLTSSKFNEPTTGKIPNLNSLASANTTGLNQATSNLTSSSITEEVATLDQGIICPSCNKSNTVNSKSCKFCGSYLSRSSGATSTLRSSTLSKTVQEVKAAHAGNSTTNTGVTDENESQSKAPNNTSTTPNKSEPSSTPTTTTSGNTGKRPLSKESRTDTTRPVRVSSQDRAKIATLAQQQKLGLVALVIFSLVLIATFLPIGSSLQPTPLDVIDQNGCMHVSVVKRQTNDAARSGELEYWTQDKAKTTVQFVKKQITVGDAGKEVDNLGKQGAEVHGYWCPKTESKLATGNVQLPKILNSNWTFKPTGEKSKEASIFSLQLKEKTLIVKETVGQTEVDRTPDIKQATYYTGQQKLAVTLNNIASSKVNAATLKEITFYLPSSQDPVAAAEGVLTNTLRPFYVGEYNAQASSLDIKKVVTYVSAALVFLSLAFLGFNFYQSRSL